MKRSLLRFILSALLLIAVFAAGLVIGQNKYGMPKTVIHVVTVKWKPEATPQQRQKALEGVKEMAEKIPGIKNIWLKTLRVQGTSMENPYDAAFVIEFENEAAIKTYETHPQHEEWYKVYIPIRAESRSHQITN